MSTKEEVSALLDKASNAVSAAKVALGALVDTPPPPPPPPHDPVPVGTYEGFGKNTTGGTGQPNYVVTNKNDIGPGSLRDALSKGDRNIVFNVTGTINLSKQLTVSSPNITIDGLSAPAPGITLRGACLSVRTGNVILRGFRHRGAPDGIDGIAVYGGRDVVLDRLSVAGFGDGAIDITQKSLNILLLRCILGAGNPAHNLMSLIKYQTARVGVYLNFFIDGEGRCPYVGQSDDAGTTASAELVADVRNNLIAGFKFRGTEVRAFGTANVVNNYYDSQSGTPLQVSDGGIAYAAGNVSKQGKPMKGNRSTPYAAEPFPMVDALAAAKAVLEQAGARGPNFGLDAVDEAFIKKISLT